MMVTGALERQIGREIKENGDRNEGWRKTLSLETIKALLFKGMEGKGED